MLVSLEENTVDYGVNAPRPRDAQLYMTRDIPAYINALSKVGDVACIEEGVGVFIENVDSLGAAAMVPIQGVDRKLMSRLIRQADIDGEIVRGIPNCRDPGCW